VADTHDAFASLLRHRSEKSRHRQRSREVALGPDGDATGAGRGYQRGAQTRTTAQNSAQIDPPHVRGDEGVDGSSASEGLPGIGRGNGDGTCSSR
jgi:hypothetical protein